MKLDLQVLTKRKLDWDDLIPDDLKPIWKSNFEMIKELGSIRFKRAVVPSDAANLNIQTIETGDASNLMACVAIYARFERKDGTFSCQLIFGRSKIISNEPTQPRAELLAANVNAQAGFVIKRAFGKYHKQAVKLTDSQIVMYWIHNKEKPLKQYVRNRVIDICRLSRIEDWKYVAGAEMVADIGTRRGARIQDVSPGSKWIEGLDWMKLPISEFPIKDISEIKLNKEEMKAVNKEYPEVSFRNESTVNFEMEEYAKKETDNPNVVYTVCKRLPDEVGKRYCYSNYLIDPNRHRFKTVIRIMAIVMRFVTMLKRRVRQKHTCVSIPESSTVAVHSITGLILSDEEIKEAEKYYYRKATNEVKQFLNVNYYNKFSSEEDGILYYTGRIYPAQEFNVVGHMTDVMTDLTRKSFYVPVIDRHSPIAYSIVDEIHWYHEIAKHSGIETVLRYTMEFGYIIEGRNLVKLIKTNCERCKYLIKQTLNVSMGPISKYNLTIAPAFYVTQVDLMGPLKAYSPHNKRSTVKIWYVVFCCTTTSAVAIKVMEGYETSDFIQAFIRFSCESGYPKLLLPDEGSQLVSGCENMKLDFYDLKYQLHLQANVEFETCPVGGHNTHGKVERKIRHVRESIEKNVMHERLSVLQWETLGSTIANSMNNMPLGLGSVVGDLENLDLITPNRLKLGRNNDRSPMGPVELTGKVNDFLRANKRIYETWFETWLTSYVPRLMRQPKWFQNDRDIQCGDLVLFLKQEKAICREYQFGMIKSVEVGRDGRIRVAVVKYRNHNENMDRETRRSVRQLVLIHPIEELDIHKELADMARYSNHLYAEEHKI